MAEGKKTAAQPAAKTTAKQAAKAPTKTIQRVNTKQTTKQTQKEDFVMVQQALGMVETRGLVASIEAADTMLKAANVLL